MAPELIKTENYDMAVDIWSFGIMAVELGQRVRPNDEGHPPDKIGEIIAQKGPPQLEKGWSNDYQNFVKRCLEIDPTKRATAKELLVDPFLLGSQNL